jgi:hypothetical protein
LNVLEKANGEKYRAYTSWKMGGRLGQTSTSRYGAFVAILVDACPQTSYMVSPLRHCKGRIEYPRLMVCNFVLFAGQMAQFGESGRGLMGA